MALTKAQKSAQISELRELLKSTKSLTMVRYRGLSVAEIDELRGKMIKRDAHIRIAKKTLFRCAAQEEGYPDVPDETFGSEPVAFVFSFSDEVSGASTAHEFGASHSAVSILGGIIDGKVLLASEAVELARIPSREDLLATFAAMLKAPVSNMAMLCSSPLGSFARGVKQIAEKKSSDH